MNEYFTKDFLTDLFDLRFRNFITLRIIKILFLLSIALSAVAALTLLINGLSSGDVGTALLSLIFAPIFFFVYVLAARIGLELVIVIFRISENIQAIGVKQGAVSQVSSYQQQTASQATSTPAPAKAPSSSAATSESKSAPANQNDNAGNQPEA